MTLINATCDATASGAESAHTEFKLPSGRTVALCQHHTSVLGSALFDQGAVLVDVSPEQIIAAAEQRNVPVVPEPTGCTAEGNLF